MSTIEQALRQYSTDSIIDTLLPYVSERRQQRIETTLSHRLESIQLVLESPYDIKNAFTILRTCECLGIQHLHIINPTDEFCSIRRLSRGAQAWIDLVMHPSLDTFFESIPHQGITLAGATPHTTNTIKDVPVNQPLYLILGNEAQGLSSTAKAHCDTLFQIPMHGMSESLNLSAAAAIALHDTCQRKRTQLGQPGDLSNNNKQQQRARYFLNSVNNRLRINLLPVND